MQEILNNLIIFIENHKNIAYIILFLGSMGESLFPLSFFMYGEVFFLTGSILAGYGILNIYIIVPLLIIGGFIGDNTSYFLGYRYGDKIISYLQSHKFFGKYLNNKNFQKLDIFFKEKGGLGVLIARFSGPLARITPFVAGSFGLKYKDFIKYDIVGVTGGIGLFIFVGYVFGRNFEGMLNILGNSILIIIITLILIYVLYILIKKILKNKKGLKKY